MAAYVQVGSIVNCFSAVDVSGVGSAGSLLGYVFDTDITNCYATGDVNGSYANFGGNAGHTSTGRITNCYATGSISGSQGDCGLVGLAAGGVGPSTITNCAALNPSVGTGRVSLDYYAVSYSNNIAWDGMTVDGVTATNGTASNYNGTDITTAQTKQKSTYEDLGWDFTADWKIEEGVSYPKLKWEE